jgi:hypothetical protein
MSIKSITFFLASLCVVLNIQSSPIRADYTSPGIDADDDVDAAIATMDMRPLLGDRENSPIILEKEDPSSVIFRMEMPEEVEKFLQDQNIMENFLGSFMAPYSMGDIIEGYETLTFAQKIGFLSDGIKEIREKTKMLENQSKLEQIENALASVSFGG